jgi:hypothetical protein
MYNVKSKSLIIFIIVFILSLILNCSNGNDSLLNSIEIYPKVNPYSGVISKWNTGVDIFMKNEQEFYGIVPKDDMFGFNSFFRTSGVFNFIRIYDMPSSRDGWDIKYMKETQIIAASPWYENNKTGVQFIKSIDFGESWKTVISFPKNSSEYFIASYFINSNEGWFFILNKSWNSTSRTRVFKLSINNYKEISTINNFSVKACYFSNSNNGYIVANTIDNTGFSYARNTYFFRTNDGGKTWNGPTQVSDEVFSDKLFSLDNDRIILMPSKICGIFSYYFYSNDQGASWSKKNFNSDKNIKDMYFVSDKVGFIKTGSNSGWTKINLGHVYKTDDGGLNWHKVTKEEVYGSVVYFLNESHGFLQDLIYGKGQVVYITNNGGKIWNEVLYPYDYVVK